MPTLRLFLVLVLCHTACFALVHAQGVVSHRCCCAPMSTLQRFDALFAKNEGWMIGGGGAATNATKNQSCCVIPTLNFATKMPNRGALTAKLSARVEDRFLKTKNVPTETPFFLPRFGSSIGSTAATNSSNQSIFESQVFCAELSSISTRSATTPTLPARVEGQILKPRNVPTNGEPLFFLTGLGST